MEPAVGPGAPWALSLGTSAGTQRVYFVAGQTNLIAGIATVSSNPRRGYHLQPELLQTRPIWPCPAGQPELGAPPEPSLLDEDCDAVALQHRASAADPQDDVKRGA